MTTHSSSLVWKIPWTEEPGRLQSMGSQRAGHGWSDLAQRQCPHLQEMQLIAHETHLAGALLPAYPGQPEFWNPHSSPLVHQHLTTQVKCHLFHEALLDFSSGETAPSLNSCTNVTSPPRHSFALSNPHPLLPLSSCSLSKALRSQPLSPHLVDAQGTWPENTGRWKPMAAEAPTLKTCPCWLLSTCSQVTNPPAEHGLTRRVTSHSAWTWWAKSGVKPKKLLLASRYKASHKGDHKTTATVYMPGPALDPRNMPSKTPKPCNNLRWQVWWVPF